VGAAIAAVAGAAAGVWALRPVFDQLTESAHAQGFAQAIAEGRILLWVRTRDAGAVERAEKVLGETGGHAVTRFARPLRETGTL
jgi:hypothetical protein